MRLFRSFMPSGQLRYIIRNLGRKKKQTFFTIACITISSVCVFSNICLNNGIRKSLKKNVNEVISGQLTIYNSTQENLNILEAQLKDQEKFLWTNEDKMKLQAVNPDLIISERIRFGSLVSFEEETSYIQIHALNEKHLIRIHQLLTLKEGKMPQQKDQIIISETMWRDLHCQTGDTLLLVADNIHGYMSDGTVTISGIFEEKGIALYFGYTGFVPYDYGKEFMQMDENTYLEFIINPVYTEEITQKEIKEVEAFLNQNHPELKIAYWQDTIPLFYTIANVWKETGDMNTVIFCIFSLTILISVATLIIQSRKKEMGTLVAIGFRWRKVWGMLCTEYLILSTTSILFSFFLIQTLLQFIPDTGLVIQSKEMQSAFMTESLELFLTPINLLYIWSAFSLVTLLAVCISLHKIRKEKIALLLKNQ